MTTKPSVRRPQRDELRTLGPLHGLPDSALELLTQHADVLRLPKGARVKQGGARLPHQLFLLQGELHLLEADGAATRLTEDTPRARLPLIPDGATGINGICARETELLRIPQNLLQQLQTLDKATDDTAAAQAARDEQLEDRIYLDFHNALQSGKVELPGMPDVAVRIARHIDAPEATSESIARIIQMDPSVTARLIQVANSPAFGGFSRIETCKEAVTRLGRRTTRDLITSFVLKGLFRARSEAVKTRMLALWQHSTQVAALCHALAKRSFGFDPAQALLIGLVHDIGVIPLLTNAHRYQGLERDEALLDRIIQRLRGDFSAMTLLKWEFAAEFVGAALEAEDWSRDKQPQADYTDILVMAQLHASIGTPRMAQLPRLDQLPAFGKLALGELSPRMSLAVLDEAQQEIDEVRGMIA